METPEPDREEGELSDDDVGAIISDVKQPSVVASGKPGKQPTVTQIMSTKGVCNNLFFFYFALCFCTAKISTTTHPPRVKNLES